VSVSSIFLITAVSNGVISMYSTMLKSGGDVIVTQKNIADTFFSDVNKSFASEIVSIKGVKRVSSIIVGAAPINTLPIAGVYGVDDNYFFHYKLISGRYPKAGEAILGNNIAKTLNDPKEITIMNKVFKVSGVFESPIGFEQGGVVVPIDSASELFHKSSSFMLVSTEPEIDSVSIQKDIGALNASVDVKTTQNFSDNYNQFKIIKTSSNAVSFIAFLLGLIGIGSMMSMAMNERKSDFGIMRALGISQSKIVLGLCMEAAILMSASFVCAWALSEAVLFVLENTPKFQGYIGGTIDIMLLFEVFATSIVMALLGAIYPAWLASKTDPAQLIQTGSA